MEMNRKQTFFLMLSIFLTVQFLGLYVGNGYAWLIRTGEMPPLVENPESIATSFIIFFYILIMTVFVLLIIRFKKVLLKVLEAIAIFFASDIVFEFFTPFYGMILAFLLTTVKVFRPTILTQNIALIFAVSGAGAIFGASFGVLPVLVFMLLLCIYDFVSVFYTKHMVYMAKAITEKPLAFTAAVPCELPGKVLKPGEKKKGKMKKIHVFQLGGGDLVIPLIFSVSVLNYYGIITALACITGSAIAVALLLQHVIRKPTPLPALPPIMLGAVLGFLIGMI